MSAVHPSASPGAERRTSIAQVETKLADGAAYWLTLGAGTIIVIAVVLLMPPYRERHWLSRFTSS